MLVTKIEQKTSTKYKVYLDGQFAFVLYKGELFRYHIKEECELPEEQYEGIMNNVIVKRAKLRALHLLNDMGRTESQLRTKLKQDGYTESVIDDTMAYVKSFGYIDDAAYAYHFIESKKHSKSRKEIYMLLMGKGVSSEIADQMMEECYDSDDTVNAIQTILRKKKYQPGVTTEKEMQKIYAALARKGFSYEDIRQVIQVSEWNA